jgi:hypothetical protein
MYVIRCKEEWERMRKKEASINKSGRAALSKISSSICTIVGEFCTVRTGM